MQSKVYDFAVIGGDLRQVYLKNALLSRNYTVCEYALCRESDGDTIDRAESLVKAAASAKTILAPIPMARADGHLNHQTSQTDLTADLLLDSLTEGQYLFAGCIPKPFLKAAWQKGVCVYDYMEDEELALYNTIATAEGAIAEAIIKSKQNLHKSKCLVLGYGRCGKTLVSLLSGFACQITVCARSSRARAEAELFAHHAVDMAEMQKTLSEYDFIFNTIPSRILLEPQLQRLGSNTVILDIASSPGGVDYQASEKLGIPAFLCPGLPGKYAPKSSAEAMAETVIKKLLQDQS